jgi:hypothetical protein
VPPSKLVQTRCTAPEGKGLEDEMAREGHPTAFIVGAALGGALGAVYGLLNAPRPGPHTRAALTERWHDVEERAAEQISQVETELRERVGPQDFGSEFGGASGNARRI